MRARWVMARLAPSPTTRGAEIGGADADGVVGAVADRIVALAGGADEGADAAEPEEVDLGLEDRLDELLRASPVSAARPSSAFISRLSVIDFSRREKTPPPGEILRAVVVLPARARQLEQAPALGEARRRDRDRDR